MFGKFNRSIDEANRLVVPAKILKELGQTFFVTIGLDKSLVLRTQDEFEKLKERLEELLSLNIYSIKPLSQKKLFS